ncbi:MAG: LPS export ABC transporter permease LptG [Motiliproteus sp.]|nr:LPS export ABC transporter permease LptG [Motiliproteus sp.]MCW9051913.1 LPS export ABC transporter permease LptG [Motiliproteus sp.]
MSVLDRYIGKTILMSCLVVILLISGLDTLFAFINEMDDLRDSYSIATASYYILLTYPGRVIEFVPMSVMVGCLVGLGVLANSSELTVMRAAGVSKHRILFSSMLPVMLLILITGVLSEFVTPKTEQLANATRTEALGYNRAANFRHGIWHREGDWFLHISAIRPGGALIGVTVYQFDEDRKMLKAGFAKRVEHEKGEWLLKNLWITHFKEDSTWVEKEKQRVWKADLEPELLGVLSVDPNNMSMDGLYRYSRYIENQNISSDTYMLAFWKKLLMPLSILGLVLVAISTIFGPLRSVTMGQRVMVGIMVGLFFSILQDILGPASTVYGFSPFTAALVPILICLGAGGWLLSRSG